MQMQEIIEIKRKEFVVIEKMGERSFKVERKGKYFFLNGGFMYYPNHYQLSIINYQLKRALQSSPPLRLCGSPTT